MSPLKVNIHTTDELIDYAVYKFYDLNDAEIEIVESSFKKEIASEDENGAGYKEKLL